MNAATLLPPLLALAGAPLLVGVANRTKAFVAGRKGPPLLQLYFDLAKLLRKGAVYSRTTTWVFRGAPVVALPVAVVAACLVPLGSVAAPFSFGGDLLLLIGALALLRLVTVLAALDTGSAFEAMGASREVQFASFAEPALLLGLGALSRATSGIAVEGAPPFSLAHLAAAVGPQQWLLHGPALALLAGAFGLVYLAENCRIPVDDPNTHLELTMIHEVMVLDHGGPDLAFILYAAAVKLWVIGALVVNIVVPVRTGIVAVDLLCTAAGMIGAGIATGLVESVMARLRLVRVPQLLVAASALSALAAILLLRTGGAPS